MNAVFNDFLRSLIALPRLLITGLIMLGSVTLGAQAATVSVSNYPLFLLSEAVTEGAPSANRLLQAGEVGHHGSISPGDIKAIKDSKFVVWFGEPLENNLAANLKTAPNAIALFEFDAFNRHPLRDVQGAAIADTLDPHIWLDPENAKAITRALAVIHSHANPQHKDLYQANAKKFAQQLDKEIAAFKQQSIQSQPKIRPYWAYHDAYQYIEDSLNLTLIGSLSTDHHLSPKASQLRWLNEQRPAKQMCLVSPSQPAKGLLAKLQPVKTTVQAEDMSASDDFISGWQSMAQQIYQCIS
ncbi:MULTISPECIES: metal ABC transporter substrate-binding protein [unclassified Psychrobacter]|uniref:metal ABC transporter substrate-binding protein n=1 Tax=unclassified Psychrobacter TaxID=196806 RepID=UPI0025B3E539|nr:MULTISPECIES: metal ABC transporter substrate-binding protein [unclassified Psychrobacter]MDN3453425.1 metal ABC transporter substrate-binding protein [Psychrobacter sp. APC 3350]MDN3501811.1 metal ABC transporter substrate-binding protein [Psychrobacter sp. 5A.1]